MILVFTKSIFPRPVHLHVTPLLYFLSSTAQKLQDENSQRRPIFSLCRPDTGSIGKVHKRIFTSTTIILSQEPALTNPSSKNTSAPPTPHPTAQKISPKFAKATSSVWKALHARSRDSSRRERRHWWKASAW